jgi:hypothetical protein
MEIVWIFVGNPNFILITIFIQWSGYTMGIVWMSYEIHIRAAIANPIVDIVRISLFFQ